MSLKTVSITSAAARTAALWAKIDRTVRESCALRCEGRNEEAANLIQRTLPALIREWSSGCGLPAETCRDALRQLFTQAQERVATAQLCKRFILGSLESPAPANALPADPARSRLHLNRRVAINDIAGMLDALVENDPETRLQRQPFTPHAAAPYAALEVA